MDGWESLGSPRARRHDELSGGSFSLSSSASTLGCRSTAASGAFFCCCCCLRCCFSSFLEREVFAGAAATAAAAAAFFFFEIFFLDEPFLAAPCFVFAAPACRSLPAPFPFKELLPVRDCMSAFASR